MRLADTRAIISGGASGLGLAAATRIIAGGGQAVLLDINLAQGAAAISALGARAGFIATDVTRENEVDAAVEQAHARMGAISA
ncbi:MAG TPA: SDR family NAD(P)-dependent oxidoreductase, partial [Steroidobacteraceae bacterium]